MRCKRNNLFIFLIAILISIQIVASQTTISDGSLTFLDISGGIECDVVGDYGNPGENWVNYGITPIDVRDSLDDCIDSSAVGNPICCPLGYECDRDNTQKCLFTSVRYCHQLGTDTSKSLDARDAACVSYADAIAINSIALIRPQIICNGISNEVDTAGVICWDTSICSCDWDNLNHICFEKVDYVNNCVDTNIINPPVIPTSGGICTWSLLSWVDLCEQDGIIEAHWQKTGTGVYEPEGPLGYLCVDIQKNLPCENIVKLGFFSPLNIVMSIIVIILIYILYPKIKGKNFKNKK